MLTIFLKLSVLKSASLILVLNCSVGWISPGVTSSHCLPDDAMHPTKIDAQTLITNLFNADDAVLFCTPTGSECNWTGLAVGTPTSVVDHSELSQLLRSSYPLWMIEEEENARDQVNGNVLDVLDKQQDSSRVCDVEFGEAKDAMAMPWTDINEDDFVLGLLELDGTIEQCDPDLTRWDISDLPCSCSMNPEASDQPTQLESAGDMGCPRSEQGTMDQGAGDAGDNRWVGMGGRAGGGRESGSAGGQARP